MDKTEELKNSVKERYGKAALGEMFKDVEGRADSESVGYIKSEIATVPAGADMGLGCGTPLKFLDIKDGDIILDIGSGGGMDCFLAAKVVGESGHVIGLDMTPEMIELARTNADKGGFTNVEFILGDAENMPLEDESVDAIVSNCALNLIPDKEQVFREAARVLRKGGCACFSDIVTVGNTPPRLSTIPKAFTACLSGAIPKSEYLFFIKQAGFSDVEIAGERSWPFFRNFASIQVKACIK